MPRSPLAYLADIVEACDTIDLALQGLDRPAFDEHVSVRGLVPGYPSTEYRKRG